MRALGWGFLVAAVAMAAGRAARADGPWEVKTAGGYLRGVRVAMAAGDAQQWKAPFKGGEQRFLAYDAEGESAVVGEGKANLWEFIPQGPNEFHIRAAEGKWKGSYLITSDRAVKDGASFSFLLELGPKPQTFNLYQVAK